MTYLDKDTQITQAGQALTLNIDAISQLSATIRNGLGPNGATKMLITPAGEIRIVKDGLTLLRNIQLAQPGAVLLSKMVTQQGTDYGDGVTSSTVIASAMLNKALEFVFEGVHPQTIINGLVQKEKEVLRALDGLKIPLDSASEHIYNLGLTALRSKFAAPQAKKFSDLLVSAIKTVTENGSTDLKMLEVVKMMNIDSTEPLRVVQGLVLDHGGRHPMMPKKLENVFILCTNLSFEYEKPELNAQFYYSRTEDKLKMEEGERRLMIERVQKVIGAMQEVAQANMSLHPQFMLITQKGIDQHALEIFARYNVLALRRAKKRNMERLQRLTGCTPIGSISELTKDVFGFAGSVKEISVGEDKFTFVEKTPFERSCTLLVQGTSPYQLEYIEGAVKSALKSISCGLTDGGILPGGASVYYNLSQTLEHPTTTSSLSPTQEHIATTIWREGLLSVPRILSKNMGHNSVETLSKIKASGIKHPTVEASKGEIIDALEHGIIDNFTVVENTIQASVLVSTKILMIDEIIRSGKEVK
ncbi:T-complex protein 1 subunit zeta [Nematocida displodere]|uniref:T-complex protein 1 subunit zeta n=1 Tax=Nematocida displodere TaxID=1805483 RepID=A0A177EJ76_9MICR|nr:T-complex protein 1 subunit zeta [Nematocida displodere]